MTGNFNPNPDNQNLNPENIPPVPQNGNASEGTVNMPGNPEGANVIPDIPVLKPKAPPSQPVPPEADEHLKKLQASYQQFQQQQSPALAPAQNQQAQPPSARKSLQNPAPSSSTPQQPLNQPSAGQKPARIPVASKIKFTTDKGAAQDAPAPNSNYPSAAELTKSPQAYEINLPPTPRKITVSMFTHNLFGSKNFIFGAITTFIALAVLFFQVPLTDFKSKKFTPDTIAITRGRIIDVKQINVLIDRFGLIRITYSYAAGPLNKIYTVNSYMDDEDYAKGDEVSIEYLKEDPGVSRALGGLTNVFEPYFLLMMLPILLLGIVPIALTVRHGMRINEYLSKGELSYGTIKVFEKHFMDIKFLKTYQFLATFSTPQGIRYAELFALTPPNINPDLAYPVLYLTDQSHSALLLDGKILSLAVTSKNKITSSSFVSKTYLQLVLPLMIIGTVLFSVYMWFTYDFQANLPVNKRFIPIERNQHDYVPKPQPKPKKLKNTPPPPLRL